jgi:hypothetical protein
VPIWIVGSASAHGCAGLSETHAELFLISKLLVVVLKITRPATGLAMAFLSVVVILGGKKPLVVLLTSNCADAAGVVVPMPTFCAIPPMVQAKKTMMVNPLCTMYRLWYLKKVEPIRSYNSNLRCVRLSNESNKLLT